MTETEPISAEEIGVAEDSSNTQVVPQEEQGVPKPEAPSNPWLEAIRDKQNDRKQWDPAEGGRSRSKPSQPQSRNAYFKHKI